MTLTTHADISRAQPKPVPTYACPGELRIGGLLDSVVTHVMEVRLRRNEWILTASAESVFRLWEMRRAARRSAMTSAYRARRVRNRRRRSR